MPGWRDEYLASLREQERNNPVNLELVELCSQLTDRVAALEAEKEALAATTKLPAKGGAKAAAPVDGADPVAAQLRFDLAEALRSKGSLQSRAKKAEDELVELRNKTKTDTHELRALTSEKAALVTKLRDREHEIKEKRKLIEDVQDEMITLNLQVAMAEKERDKVKRENKELIDRWMKRMAQEADAMNLANEPHFDNKR
ncbi:hypothetical protein D7B24_001419 [Verticillium nonalfalfae]|uniref:Autophagy-related protein 16 domain-containing protein n=1 Tax=Verticillium nonalfalfae TaxID=1051616 RepID=A0A3M9XZM1_9PEZI|nr:uncharacterized protein D7B24_001419 [Verticillium nonalfalfae]RNJ53727.1 hypothetical protein D7B24_001419 [Verticillium nonalfalfae]